MTATRHVHIVPVPTDEPRDRLSPQDMAIINGALHLYYAESQDCLASHQELHRISQLSRRLADVSLRWVAEEVTE